MRERLMRRTLSASSPRHESAVLSFCRLRYQRGRCGGGEVNAVTRASSFSSEAWSRSWHWCCGVLSLWSSCWCWRFTLIWIWFGEVHLILLLQFGPKWWADRPAVLINLLTAEEKLTLLLCRWRQKYGCWQVSVWDGDRVTHTHIYCSALWSISSFCGWKNDVGDQISELLHELETSGCLMTCMWNTVKYTQQAGVRVKYLWTYVTGGTRERKVPPREAVKSFNVL